MNGKKMAFIIVTIIIVASAAVAISMKIFFATYEPKKPVKSIPVEESSTSWVEQPNLIANEIRGAL